MESIISWPASLSALDAIIVIGEDSAVSHHARQRVVGSSKRHVFDAGRHTARKCRREPHSRKPTRLLRCRDQSVSAGHDRKSGPPRRRASLSSRQSAQWLRASFRSLSTVRTLTCRRSATSRADFRSIEMLRNTSRGHSGNSARARLKASISERASATRAGRVPHRKRPGAHRSRRR